jgi:glucokinase
VTNDANAAAYGEMIYGGAKKMKNFIMFTIGTGVGSGIVVDGKLVYGHDGNAGEIGHTIIFPEGRPCNCGSKGCLEQYTSARGIRKTCIEMMKNIEDHTGLEDVISHDYGFKAITKAAMNGNQLANQVLAKTGEILGLALANSVAYTSPEAIFLMGGPLKAGNILLDPIRKSFDEKLLSIYKGKTQILVSKLKENEAAILGAAALTNRV